MDEEPDLNFNIDALFDHLINNLGHIINDEKDWDFSLRSSDLNILEQVAGELDHEFTVRLQENVEKVGIDGNVSLGDPLLSVVRRGALSVDEVKQIAERMQTIASERGLTYEGVDCYDPIDEEEMFGWLDPDDAGWRLRHMTDCGLEGNAELPWAFLVLAPILESTNQIAGALTANGFDDRDDYDEPDEKGNFGMCVFVAGRNNESELHETAKRIAALAECHGGYLTGIQFYTREDLAEIFGIEEET